MINRQEKIVKYLVLIIPFIIYAQVYITNYGYLDAYYFLDTLRAGGDNILLDAMSGGRDLSGILTQFLFQTFNTINKLKYIRFISVVFISIFSYLLYLILLECGYKKESAAFFSIISICMPAFQIYASWSVLVGAPISAIMALIASSLSIKNVNIKRFFAQAFFILISLLFYQPTAMIFFSIFPIILHYKLTKKEARLVIFSFYYVLSGFVGMVLAYIAIRISPVFGIVVSNRASLDDNIYHKIHWFIFGPLINSTNIFMLKQFIIPIIVISLAFLYLLAGDKYVRKPIFIISFIFMIPLSYIPNLVVHGDWASNRTTIGLQLLWCVVLLIFVEKIINSYNLKKIFLFLFISVFILFDEKNVNEEYVIPNTIEYSYALHKIKALDPKNNSTICVHPDMSYDTTAKYTSFDDFGESSFFASWSSSAIFQDASNEVYPNRALKYINYSKNKSDCNYYINTMNISSYRTFKSKLYSIGSNE